MIKKIFFSTFIAMAAAMQASAEVQLAERIHPGSHVDGPDYSEVAELQGNVVIVEMWGRHCPPCLASIPHLTELAEEHTGDGLSVIALQCQGGADESTADIWNARERSNAVSVFNGGRCKDFPGGAIPFAIVYGRDGEIVYAGHPMGAGMDNAVEDALRVPTPAGRRAPEAKPLVFPGQYPQLSEQAEELSSALQDPNRSRSETVGELRDIVEDVNEKSEEAQKLLDALGAWVEERIVAGKKRMDDNDIVGACLLLQPIVVALEGDLLGEEAEALVGNYFEDSVVMFEIEAEKELQRIVSMALAAKIGTNEVDMPATEVITSDLQAFQLKYSGTVAARKSIELEIKWQLNK